MPDPQLAATLDAPWLGLIIGNTRLHWGIFHQQQLLEVWHTPQLLPEHVKQLRQQNFAAAAWRSLTGEQTATIASSTALAAIAAANAPLPLYCVSVVPAQTALWQTDPAFREVTLTDVPLHNLYDTLGIDRALNLLGAGDLLGWPVLVIDAGTALTFTAGTAGAFVGGAILPGLMAQFSILADKTAMLPPAHPTDYLPPRWATNTLEAMQSGVVYSTLATLNSYVQAWRQEHDLGKAVLTGGDGARLCQWYHHSQAAADLSFEPHLAFWGLRSLQRQLLTTDRSF